MISFANHFTVSRPTGHYWFTLAAWLITAGISVVQVNPYAVKQSKEIEDNSQLKDDKKDPKLIANLVKDGNYGMPYLPEEIYADMRRLSMLRDQLTEDRIRNITVFTGSLRFISQNTWMHLEKSMVHSHRKY